MSVLAINLAPTLLRDFAREPRLELKNARSIDQALDWIESEDFQVVIEDARGSEGVQNDLAQLLAATPPGTVIYALVSNMWLPESEYWRAQGIKLVFEEPFNYLLTRLLPNTPL